MISLLLTALLMVQGVPAASFTTGAIAGRVLLVDGAPGTGLRVMAVEESAPTGPKEKPSVAGLTETDAMGQYVLTGIPPGRYLIVAGSLAMPTYYPNAAVRKDATPVVVTARGSVQEVNIRFISDEARIAPLFASDDPVDQAWAAWFAGETGKVEWTAVIEEKLKKALADGRGGTTTELLIDALADALIRFNAKPPADLARALYLRRPPEALILMSHLGAAANADLLDILGFGTDVLWAGIANQLLANKSPGFVFRLLIPLQLSAQLTVCYSESNCPNVMMAGVGGRVGVEGDGVISGIPPVIPGPPWPTYSLAIGGSTLLANGPIKIYYSRQVAEPGANPRASVFVRSDGAPGTPSETDRMNYIAAAAPSVILGIKAFEQRKTVYRDDEQMKAEAEAFRDDILRRYASLLEQLRKTGALTAAEAERVAVPRLNLVIGGDAGLARR